MTSLLSARITVPVNVIPRIVKSAADLSDPNPVDSEHIFQQLLQNYPPASIAWVRKVPWIGPVEVPLDRIDWEDEKSWAAHHQVAHDKHFAKRILAGDADVNPIVAVHVPGNDKAKIIDGHHRAEGYRIAAKKRPGIRAKMYIGFVPTDNSGDPWFQTHVYQEHQGGSPANKSAGAVQHAVRQGIIKPVPELSPQRGAMTPLSAGMTDALMQKLHGDIWPLFGNWTNGGKLRVRVADLVKVGPEGYIHGYICVRPPCGPKYKIAMFNSKNGSIDHDGQRIGKLRLNADKTFSVTHHDNITGGGTDKTKLQATFADRKDAAESVALYHNVNAMHNAAVASGDDKAAAALKDARTALADGNHDAAAAHLVTAQMAAQQAGNYDLATHAADTKAAVQDSKPPLNAPAEPSAEEWAAHAAGQAPVPVPVPEPAKPSPESAVSDLTAFRDSMPPWKLGMPKSYGSGKKNVNNAIAFAALGNHSGASSALHLAASRFTEAGYHDEAAKAKELAGRFSYLQQVVKKPVPPSTAADEAAVMEMLGAPPAPAGPHLTDEQHFTHMGNVNAVQGDLLAADATGEEPLNHAIYDALDNAKSALQNGEPEAALSYLASASHEADAGDHMFAGSIAVVHDDLASDIGKPTLPSPLPSAPAAVPEAAGSKMSTGAKADITALINHAAHTSGGNFAVQEALDDAAMAVSDGNLPEALEHLGDAHAAAHVAGGSAMNTIATAHNKLAAYVPGTEHLPVKELSPEQFDAYHDAMSVLLSKPMISAIASENVGQAQDALDDHDTAGTLSYLQSAHEAAVATGDPKAAMIFNVHNNMAEALGEPKISKPAADTGIAQWEKDTLPEPEKLSPPSSVHGSPAGAPPAAVKPDLATPEGAAAAVSAAIDGEKAKVEAEAKAVTHAQLLAEWDKGLISAEEFYEAAGDSPPGIDVADLNIAPSLPEHADAYNEITNAQNDFIVGSPNFAKLQDAKGHLAHGDVQSALSTVNAVAASLQASHDKYAAMEGVSTADVDAKLASVKAVANMLSGFAGGGPGQSKATALDEWNKGLITTDEFYGQFGELPSSATTEHAHVISSLIGESKSPSVSYSLNAAISLLHEGHPLDALDELKTAYDDAELLSTAIMDDIKGAHDSLAEDLGKPSLPDSSLAKHISAVDAVMDKTYPGSGTYDSLEYAKASLQSGDVDEALAGLASAHEIAAAVLKNKIQSVHDTLAAAHGKPSLGASGKVSSMLENDLAVSHYDSIINLKNQANTTDVGDVYDSLDEASNALTLSSDAPPMAHFLTAIHYLTLAHADAITGDHHELAAAIAAEHDKLIDDASITGMPKLSTSLPPKTMFSGKLTPTQLAQHASTVNNLATMAMSSPDDVKNHIHDAKVYVSEGDVPAALAELKQAHDGSDDEFTKTLIADTHDNLQAASGIPGKKLVAPAVPPPVDHGQIASAIASAMNAAYGNSSVTVMNHLINAQNSLSDGNHEDVANSLQLAYDAAEGLHQSNLAMKIDQAKSLLPVVEEPAEVPAAKPAKKMTKAAKAALGKDFDNLQAHIIADSSESFKWAASDHIVNAKDFVNKDDIPAALTSLSAAYGMGDDAGMPPEVRESIRALHDQLADHLGVNHLDGSPPAAPVKKLSKTKKAALDQVLDGAQLGILIHSDKNASLAAQNTAHGHVLAAREAIMDDELPKAMQELAAAHALSDEAGLHSGVKDAIASAHDQLAAHLDQKPLQARTVTNADDIAAKVAKELAGVKELGKNLKVINGPLDPLNQDISDPSLIAQALRDGKAAGLVRQLRGSDENLKDDLKYSWGDNKEKTEQARKHVRAALAAVEKVHDQDLADKSFAERADELRSYVAAQKNEFTAQYLDSAKKAMADGKPGQAQSMLNAAETSLKGTKYSTTPQRLALAADVRKLKQSIAEKPVKVPATGLLGEVHHGFVVQRAGDVDPSGAEHFFATGAKGSTEKIANPHGPIAVRYKRTVAQGIVDAMPGVTAQRLAQVAKENHSYHNINADVVKAIAEYGLSAVRINHSADVDQPMARYKLAASDTGHVNAVKNALDYANQDTHQLSTLTKGRMSMLGDDELTSNGMIAGDRLLLNYLAAGKDIYHEPLGHRKYSGAITSHGVATPEERLQLARDILSDHYASLLKTVIPLQKETEDALAKVKADPGLSPAVREALKPLAGAVGQLMNGGMDDKADRRLIEDVAFHNDDYMHVANKETGRFGYVPKNSFNPDLFRKLSDAEVHQKLQDILQAHADRLAKSTEISPEDERQLRAEIAGSLVNLWAGSSNDSHIPALAVQMAAEKEFGLQDSMPWEDAVLGTKQKVKDFYDANKETLHKFVRAQYENTQKELKAAGITSVTLHRGMRWGSKNKVPAWMKTAGSSATYGGKMKPVGSLADVKESDWRPLSSWSHSSAEAHKFYTGGGYGAQVKASVPAHLIFSTPRTGNGCLHEKEWVVLGGAGQLKITKSKGY